MSAPRIVPATEQQIERSAALLAAGGGVVAFPTETLYGLAVDALNGQAVEQLLALKGRASRHPVGLLVSDEQMLASVVTSIPPLARQLMQRHWPGPLTLVLPAASGLPPALVNRCGGVGVRVSSDPVASALVARLGRPITATSANRTGGAGATTATQVVRALPAVTLVLDDGERNGVASAVVDFGGAGPVVLRRGSLDLDFPAAGLTS